MVKGTRGPEESEENTMSKFENSVMRNGIMRNGGYIVHKPSKELGIGLVYKGNDGCNPVFGHDCAMIFLDELFAWSVAHDLGDEWLVMDVRDITPERFMEMEALAAIFD